MSNQKGYTSVGIIYVLIIVLSIGGWIANIVKLAGMDDVLIGEGILRIVGIFVPFLGAVMGYI